MKPTDPTRKMPMHANQSTVLTSLRTILCGSALLAVLGWGAPSALAVPDPAWTNYAAFAVAQGWAEVDAVTGRTTYEGAYGPNDDVDGDGLTNLREFNGWSAVVNGATEWYTWNRTTYNGAVAD